ncbi:MAG: GtrA family protein [Bacteroidota bacterium]
MPELKENAGLKEKLISLFRQKFKFALSSGVATLVDYGIFFVAQNYIVVGNAQLLGQGCGMLLNFFLQKTFVFDLKRKLGSAFLIAMLVSGGGLLIGKYLIEFLVRFTFFQEHLIIAKLLITGMIFFYNFYLKRFAFEKKLHIFDKD